MYCDIRNSDILESGNSPWKFLEKRMSQLRGFVTEIIEKSPESNNLYLS